MKLEQKRKLRFSGENGVASVLTLALYNQEIKNHHKINGPDPERFLAVLSP